MDNSTSARGLSRLEGRHAIVTAAAQGIGRAIALRFAAEGARVTALDLDAAGLAGIAGERIATRVVDVTDLPAFQRVVDDAADTRILVNCVGWVHQGTILECSPEEWQRAFRLNVDSIYHAIRFVLPRMRAAGGGNIVNVASLAGLRAAPNRAAYAATKSAVIGITRSVAIDYARDGVRCNAICPAMVDTPSLAQRINTFPDPEAARAMFISRHPIGRLGRPEEIAAMAAYLASDESGFVTGATMQMDGGAAA